MPRAFTSVRLSIDAIRDHVVGESSQTDSGSGEPGSHLVLPVLEHNPGQNRESHLTSGTPHKLGHVGMPPLVVDDVSPGSIVGDDSVEGNEPVVDQEMMRIELQLDSWTLELKRNILVCQILCHTLFKLQILNFIIILMSKFNF